MKSEFIETLINRVSCGRLTQPAPSKEHMDLLFQAALRAPDHKGLKPWQYLVYSGSNALCELGEAFLKASVAQDPELPLDKQQRMQSLPHRAPMVVIAVAKNNGHEKVPHIEEVVSTGAGVQSLLLGAYELGYGAYWRTGPLAYNERLKPLLGLEADDTIVGFIYLGTPEITMKAKPIPEVKDFVTWK
ncbi:MAG: nitroreductase [Kangiellaceae bacterium]|nr:nitroreductase [Kangiellaceae bacterium]